MAGIAARSTVRTYSRSWHSFGLIGFIEKFLTFDFRFLAPLVDLFLENLPFKCHSKQFGWAMRSWNEIRSLAAPVAVYFAFPVQSREEIAGEIEEVVSALPYGIVLEVNPSYQWTDRLMQYGTEVSIIVSDRHRRVLPVVVPWQGSAERLQDSYWKQRPNLFSFMMPFINGSRYAIMSRSTTRRGGGMGSWVNSEHSKMGLFWRLRVDWRGVDITRVQQSVFCCCCTRSISVGIRVASTSNS